MRSCPHCHKEIQDEAVFCRFCRRDVDPPLWLTSLQKCPFCAEWVERGIERCPLCGKDLSSSTPFSIPAEEVEQASDLFSRLRQSVPAMDALDDDEDENEPGDQQSYTEAGSEPALHETQAGQPGSWFDRLRKAPETRAAEPDEGLAVLHERRIDLREDYAPPAEQDEGTDAEREISESRLAQIGATIVRWVLIAVTAGVLVVVGVLGYQRIMSAGVLPLQASETPDETSLETQPSEATATTAPTIPAGTPGVLLPTLPGGPPECVSWDQITLEMAGQTACAYGNIKRWFEVSDIPYVAIFSEQPGTFAFIDRDQTHPEFRPGTCITASGIIEIMRATRPFIDVEGDLQECGPEIQKGAATATPTP